MPEPTFTVSGFFFGRPQGRPRGWKSLVGSSVSCRRSSPVVVLMTRGVEVLDHPQNVGPADADVLQSAGEAQSHAAGVGHRGVRQWWL
jgi:hypothetical protein